MQVPIDSTTTTSDVCLPWRLCDSLVRQMAIDCALVEAAVFAAALAGGREKKAP